MLRLDPALLETENDKNPRQHRLAELHAFEELLRDTLEGFQEDQSQRKTEEEDEIFRELIREGIDLTVITIQLVADAALTDASAAGRWVKGSTAPAKRKQVKILQAMLERVGEARQEIGRKSQAMQKALDAAAEVWLARRQQ